MSKMDSEPHNIDAEYMNRWLGEGSRIDNLSPKVLFDVQTLLEYYRDIIVPTADINISFPREDGETPRASVANGEVLIPYYMLRDGRVDETIGAMIHELHHIKWSASEKFTCALTFKYLRKLMEEIECVGMTLAERVFSNSGLTIDAIMSEEDTVVPADVAFMRKMIGDLMFILNAVEDVRIDANTPPNLRKYIDKIDNNASEHLKEMLDNLDGDTSPTAIAYSLLAHHKGHYNSEFVKERYGDTDAILKGNPHEYPLDVFKAFQEEIAKHIHDSFIEICGQPKPQSEEMGEVDFDLDAYFGEKINQNIGDSLCQQFDKAQTGKPYKAKNAEEQDALNKIEEQIELIEVTQPTPYSGDVGTKQPYTAKEDGELLQSEKRTTPTPPTAEEYREQQLDLGKNVFMDNALIQSVKSFKNIRVYTTTESFDDTKVVYDTVIFDTLN